MLCENKQAAHQGSEADVSFTQVARANVHGAPVFDLNSRANVRAAPVRRRSDWRPAIRPWSDVPGKELEYHAGRQHKPGGETRVVAALSELVSRSSVDVVARHAAT